MIDIKKELANLDKSDFIKVCDLVDKIITDIWITAKQEKNEKWRDELKIAITKDYMIDLLNPDLLDFDKEEP
jgi:hypothetical protein